MKYVTISFSQDPDVCRTLFFSCYRRSISGFFRIIFLLYTCAVILALLYLSGFLSSPKSDTSFFWSMLFLIGAALVLMVFCLSFFLLYPRIRFHAHLFAADSLNKNGTILKSISFLEDSLKLDLLICHTPETRCIPCSHLKKCTVVRSGISIVFHKDLPALLLPKTLFRTEEDFLTAAALLGKPLEKTEK